MNAKEKKHRLPKEFYKGEVSVAFTLCLKINVAAGFNLRGSTHRTNLRKVAAGFSLRNTYHPPIFFGFKNPVFLT